jgi:glycerophosphoryl diester phosphodiesterase
VKVQRSLDGSENSCDQPDDLAERFARRAREVLEGAGVLERAVFMCTSRGTLRTLQREFAGTPAHFTFDQEIPAGIPKVGSHSAVDPAMQEGCDYASIGRPVGLRAWKVYRQVIARDLEKLAALRRAARTRVESFGQLWGLGAPSADESAAEVPRLIAWTVNDPDELRALVEMGVDGILTDRPGVLAKLVRERDASK